MNKIRNKIIISVNIVLAVLLLLISSSFIFVGSSRDFRIYGTEKILGRNFPQDYFDSVSIGGTWTVDIQYGPVSSVLVETHENLFPYLDIYVANHMLYIGFKNGYIIDHCHCKVSITMPVLRQLKASGQLIGSISSFKMRRDTMKIIISGSGSIVADTISVKNIYLDISGSESCEVIGEAQKMTAHISGTGNIQADQLKTARAAITISGSGSAYVWITESLDADISGSGSIQYKGNPYVKGQISGRGRVIPSI